MNFTGGLDHQKFVLRQNDKNFILDGWDPYKYSHIICDEVDLEKFDQEIYKLITEGAQISANRKNEKAITVSCRVPMIFICNKKPKRFPGLYERLHFVKADKFVKILNINEYLRVDWSIPENQLRCQPNPDLMPVFKCLNTVPPSSTNNSLINDSALDMTPNSLSNSQTIDGNKYVEKSSSIYSNKEDITEGDDIIKRPKQTKSLKRFLESDDENGSSLKESSNSLENYTLNDILNGKQKYNIR